MLKKLIESKRYLLVFCAVFIIILFSNLIALNSYRLGYIKFPLLPPIVIFLLCSVLGIIAISSLVFYILLISKLLNGIASFSGTFIFFSFSLIPKIIAEALYFVVDDKYFDIIGLVSSILVYACILVSVKQINDFSLKKATVVLLAIVVLMFTITAILL